MKEKYVNISDSAKVNPNEHYIKSRGLKINKTIWNIKCYKVLVCSSIYIDCQALYCPVIIRQHSLDPNCMNHFHAQTTAEPLIIMSFPWDLWVTDFFSSCTPYHNILQDLLSFFLPCAEFLINLSRQNFFLEKRECIFAFGKFVIEMEYSFFLLILLYVAWEIISLTCKKRGKRHSLVSYFENFPKWSVKIVLKFADL